jgi:hypothetical protein
MHTYSFDEIMKLTIRSEGSISHSLVSVKFIVSECDVFSKLRFTFQNLY